MKTALGDIEIVSRLGADERTLAFDVLDGLTRPFKEIPPKHFYDTEGSRLFEAITHAARVLPDAHRAGDPDRQRGARSSSRRGWRSWSSSAAACRPRRCCCWTRCATPSTLDRYVPFDVSEVVLTESAKMLVERYPGIRVFGVVGDFERHLDALPPAEGPRVIVFLGGTIGNFPPGSRRRFLRSLGRALRPQDRLLLGTDLVKDPAVLEAAYNDSAGVTAAFNRNMLAVVNRELDADFDLDAFEHVAFYDREQEWIEMRLRALRPAGRAGPQARADRALRQPRGAAHGDQRQVHARSAWRPTSPPPGCGCDEYLTDPDELFALSLAGVRPAR